MSGPPPLHLVVLGRPGAQVAGAPAPAEVLWRKHFALLAYLACSPGLSRSRAHLLAMLWPEREESRARHSLNEALHRLRDHLGAGRLLTDGETVTLAAEALSVDAWENPAEPPGEFLEGFALPDNLPFDEWLEGERRRLRERVVPAMIAQAKALMAAGTPARAVPVARAARERDPLDGGALQVLMEALALSGSYSAALTELRDYRQRLAEIGESPGPGLIALAHRINAGLAAPTAGPAVRRPPLVGRAEILAALAELLPGHRQGPAIALIFGAPGEGKSRMLEELELRAMLAGCIVARSVALPSDQGSAGSALRGLFRGGLLAAPGLIGTAPAELARLAVIVPDLAQRFPPPASADHGELAFALAQALESVAGESPVLLLLDDAHLADGASLGIIQAAFERMGRAQVTLALAAAPNDPDSAPELLRLQAETGRRMSGVSVVLQPFSSLELAQLVGELAPWAESWEAQDRLVRRLLHETSGNPLLAVTLLQELADAVKLRADATAWPFPTQTLSAPLPVQVPQLIQSAVLEKTIQLEPGSRELLCIAACLGTRIDVELLTAVTGLTEETLAERLAQPERLRLIAATDEGYAFPGALVATVLEGLGLTSGRRRECRRRAAAVLSTRSEPAARLWRLELLAKAGPREAFAGEAIELGAMLLERGDRHGARRALLLVDGVVPESNREAWVALRSQLDGGTAGPPGSAA